jgi:hypothetical protein
MRIEIGHPESGTGNPESTIFLARLDRLQFAQVAFHKDVVLWFQAVAQPLQCPLLLNP